MWQGESYHVVKVEDCRLLGCFRQQTSFERLICMDVGVPVCHAIYWNAR